MMIENLRWLLQMVRDIDIDGLSIMPYITALRRQEIDNGGFPMTAGELNYVITTKALEYLHNTELNYQTLNDIIGAFEGAKLEFYERVVRPYEESAIQRNGDVY